MFGSSNGRPCQYDNFADVDLASCQNTLPTPPCSGSHRRVILHAACSACSPHLRHSLILCAHRSQRCAAASICARVLLIFVVLRKEAPRAARRKEEAERRPPFTPLALCACAPIKRPSVKKRTPKMESVGTQISFLNKSATQLILKPRQ